MSELHVLSIPSFYPTARKPLTGIFMKELIEAVHKAGVRIGVIYPDVLPLRELSSRSVTTHHFQIDCGVEDGVPTCRLMTWNVLPRLRARHGLWVWQVERLATHYARKHGRPDVIHAHNALWGGVAARRISRAMGGVPYVVTEHSSAFRRGMVGESDVTQARAAYASASAVIAISPVAGDHLVEMNLLDRAKLEIIPNLAHFDFFTLPPEGARPTPPPFRFIDVTLLDPIKRIDWLLQAFASAFRGDPDVVLDLTGDGPHRARLESLARELGVASQVNFLGSLDRDGVRHALWRAHAFVHASAYETFGVALVEAMATGLPVLSTACGGPNFSVTPDVGRLAAVENLQGFVEAMGWMRENAGSFDPAAVREAAYKRFSEPRVAARMQDIYRSVLS